MPKIAFHLNCLEQGGAERVVSNLANQFSREGYEVIVATEWQGENEFQLEEKVRRVHVGLKPQDEQKNRLQKIRLRKKYLRQFLKEERPDIAIAFAHKANYRLLMAGNNLSIPMVISVRTDPVGHYDAITDKIQIAWLFKRAAGNVFQTAAQRDFFPQYTREHSKIILNPINDKYLNVPEPENRVKTVVQSGRLVDFKNQPMLIKSFLKVHKKHPDYDLKIYGGDSLDGTKEILEQLIQDNSAESYIHLMGASDELEKQLVNASVYAFSSDWEGLPNALLEAMALGLPIVATDCPCGGPAMVIENEKNGLLIPIKDEDALADGICRLIEDQELASRLGQEARKIKEIASGKEVINQWRDYLETLMKTDKL